MRGSVTTLSLGRGLARSDVAALHGPLGCVPTGLTLCCPGCKGEGQLPQRRQVEARKGPVGTCDRVGSPEGTHANMNVLFSESGQPRKILQSHIEMTRAYLPDTHQ